MRHRTVGDKKKDELAIWSLARREWNYGFGVIILEKVNVIIQIKVSRGNIFICNYTLAEWIWKHLLFLIAITLT